MSRRVATTNVRRAYSPEPSLFMTMLVRDEADIIRSVLDYHLDAGVEHIVVTDNGSVDGTRDVLAEYQRLGPVTVFDEPPSDFSQGVWVTRMSRHIADRFGAGWVVHGDADEFFVCRSCSLRSWFGRRSPGENVVHVDRHDFVCQRGEEPLDPRAATVRKVESLNVFGCPLPPKVSHRAHRDATVQQGNHEVDLPDYGLAAERLELFHYPIRSYAQFESKVRNAGSGYAKNRKLSESEGAHKRRWYAMFLNGTLRKEYERLTLSGEEVRAGLSDGSLTEDAYVTSRFA